MDYMDGRGAAQLVNAYIEREMSEYRRIMEREVGSGNAAPSARAAFYRKPYYGDSNINLKTRPVLRDCQELPI